MRARALVAALTLGAAACRTLPPPPGDAHGGADAHVEGLALSFTPEAEGTLELDLAVPGRPRRDGVVAEVEWELWLEGRAVASGLARVEQPLPAGAWTTVRLRLPLVFRHLGWTADTRTVAVRVTGKVARRFGLDVLWTGFDERRKVQSAGSVVFER